MHNLQLQSKFLINLTFCLKISNDWDSLISFGSACQTAKVHSMIKNPQGWRMKTSLKNNEKVVIRSFPGASTDDLSFHSVPSMKRNPRCLVLHTGTNDFRDEKDDDQIAKTIYGLAKTLKTDENTVYVSGIIERDDKKVNARISNVNEILKEQCEGANFPFIENSNIEICRHLNRSGLHLNHFGDAKLAFNIISALRN